MNEFHNITYQKLKKNKAIGTTAKGNVGEKSIFDVNNY